MAIRGILFDNDGTLVDTHDLILESFRYTLKAVLGAEPSDEEIMRGVGTPLAAQMATFSDNRQIQEELLRVYREHNHAHHDQTIAAFPGVVDGLARLHDRGIVIGVVTAKMHALAWHGLEIVGAAPYLSCLIGADDCALSKPDPAPIAQAVTLLGLAPEECLYVGDSPYDIQAGNAAGCITVAVLWGMFSEGVLQAENPAHVITSFSELEALI